jgi:hypothetical protein
MGTLYGMITFSFRRICDLVEFYAVALVLLAAPMKRHGCDGKKILFFCD